MGDEKVKYNIKAKHFFMFSKMYSMMGLKREINFNAYDMSKKDGQIKLGTELINGFISNLYKVEEESYKFLADVVGWKIEKVIDMGADEYLETWQDLLKNNQMVGFIKKLLKSTGMRKLTLFTQDTEQEQEISSNSNSETTVE